MTAFQKYFLSSFFIALLSAVLLLVFFVPRFDHTDTPQYISTIKYISGDPSAEIFPFRILKPLPILIGAGLTPFLAAENTLIAQNLVFYFLSVCLIFLLVHRLYRDEKQAFYGAVLYIGAYPMLAYGLASLTDLSGWFFYLFSVLAALSFLKKPRLKMALLSGLIAGLGMLFKENVAAAPIFFAGLVFIASRLPLKEKLKYLSAFGGAFLLFPLINSFVIYQLYSVTYLDWFKHAWGVSAQPRNTFYLVSPLRVIIEIGRVFLIGWIFIFWGAFKEFTLKNVERLKILLAFIFPSLSFFVWSYPHNRMIFIAFPFLVLLGSYGLLRPFNNPKINTSLELVLISLYILVNYTLLEFLLRYGVFLQDKF